MQRQVTAAALRPDTAASSRRLGSRVTVGIIADDLTGAGDSIVQFAEAGWATSLALTDTIAVNTGGVIAIVTDVRAQPFETAQTGSASAVAQLHEAGIDRLFVKIDSTMRGSVHAQIRGALSAWGEAHAGDHSATPSDSPREVAQRPFAIVCPAYPGMGRTLQGGRLLVNGVAVELTSIGRDPMTPVPTGLVSALIPGSMHLAIGTDEASALADRITALVTAGIEIVTFDAITDAEMEIIAEATVLLGPAAIPVGSAGLAIAMSRFWAPAASAAEGATFDLARVPRSEADRILVVVSSLHDVSREQHRHLVTLDLAERVRTLEPTLADLADEASTTNWIAGELGRSIDFPRVVVILSPAERHHATQDAANPNAGHNSDVKQNPASLCAAIRVATGLAELTEAVLKRTAISALVLMGGEGARAVLDRLRSEAIRVTGAIREGIPMGIIEGGQLDGVAVVTKAGGFGDRSTLADLIPELLAATNSTDPMNHSQGAQS